MGFPRQRLRRLRQDESLRRMVQETTLTSDSLIYPLFVTCGEGRQEPIASMPGQFRWSIDLLVKEAAEAKAAGVPAVILFGIPEQKDERGSAAYDKEGIVQRAIRELKDQLPELFVITDVCIDEYTSHGHCGLVREGRILNDETLHCLRLMARTHAEAGVNMVAPSDMMDGRVGAIRDELDQMDFQDIPIMAYSAKYASSLYAPFREAADSSPAFGDRRSYQMDPANAREALREVTLDLEEGADVVMVKPALFFLDIIRLIRDSISAPLAAYQVSGEYSMIKAAAQAGWIDQEKVMMESLLSIKRAGADIILTYFAKEAARLLNDGLR